MNRLILNERPLLVMPELAELIGLNQAILLQQIHYWLEKKLHFKDGCYWVYNTHKEWKKQFPFWSVSTIKRTITSLKNQNLIITGNYNKVGFDKTVWYTIDYDTLNSMSQRVGQNELTRGSKWTNGTGQNELTYTIDYPKTTTENINTSVKSVKNERKNNLKQFLEYIYLTDEEYKRLTDEYLKQDVDSKIEDLDNYLGMIGKPKKYKDHNRVIRQWLKKERVKTKQQKREEFENRYKSDSIET